MVTALIVVASYVSLGRYFIGYVEQYQQPLVERFVEFTGLSISVDRLHGHWSRLSPVLTMEGLTLYRPSGDSSDTDAVLTIGEVSFQLDPIQSIFNWLPQVHTLMVSDLDLALEEVETGRWQLKGYPTQALPDSSPTGSDDFEAIVDLIMSVQAGELINARIQTFFSKGEKARLTVKELSLNHRDNFRRLRVNAIFDQSNSPLVAIVEASGDPREQDTFSAQAYINLDDVDFAGQLPAAKVLGIESDDARVDGKVWLDWQPESKVSVQGLLQMPVLDIGALSGLDLPPLNDLAFGFRAEKTSDHKWQAWLPILEANWNKQRVSFNRSHLAMDSEQIFLSVPELNLDEVNSQILSVGILTEKLSAVLSDLAPKGLLHNVKVDISKSMESGPTTPLFRLRAEMDNVEVSPWTGAPGATGVSGYLSMEPNNGKVELNSDNFSMEFPLVYRDPLKFSSAFGQVHWSIEGGRVLVDSSPLQLTASEHGPATVLLDLDLNTDSAAEIPPQMTLTVGLRDTAAQHRNKFIPYTLNRDFLSWMDVAVPSGHVIDGGFIYRGSLRKDDSQGRTVQLFLDVSDTTLDYHPQWPKLTAIEGLVEVSDSNVNVTASSAKMFSMDVKSTSVNVQSLSSGGMWLTVDTFAEGSSADALRIVNESAIQDMVGSVFNNWIIDGKANAKVSLGIPLAGASSDPDINVAVNLSSTQVTIPEYRLSFSDVKGPLNYTSEKGIYSSGISAKLYDKKATVSVVQNDGNAVVLDFDGIVDMRDVEQWSQQAALDFLSGETKVHAQISVVPGGESLFSVNSSLDGVAIDLPYPYGKEPQSKRDYWLKLPIGEQAPLLEMGLGESDQAVKLQLQLNNGEVNSGMIVLGEADDIRHESHYIVVTGRMAHFELDKWQPLLDRYIKAEDLIQKNMIANAESTIERNSKISLKVRSMVLDKFSGFNQHYDRSLVNLNKHHKGWRLSAKNSELAGVVTFPFEADDPIAVKLQALYLYEKEGDEQGIISPGDIPTDLTSMNNLKLDIAIDNLFLDDERYGNLTFEMRGHELGVRFENIVGELRGIIAKPESSVNLEWLTTASGEKSRLYGEFSMRDIGDVLEHWNYERIIESESATASIDLTWPGTPQDWELSASSGPVDIKVRDGRFLKAPDSASGTLKVVGIVNLTNIVRRLQLDFSDIFKSGISFDRIEGEAVIADNFLKIVDDLEVKSPSTSFLLRGNADLVEKALDMELIATLPIASNLPWIAALAGGLPTAASVYIASLIFEEQMDRFSSAVYSVKGDWNNPELNFTRVYDDGKK